MSAISRRSAIRAAGSLVVLGAGTSLAVAADEKKPVGALQPHWIDKLVGTNKDQKVVKKAICQSKEFTQTIAKAIDLATKAVAKRPKDFVGPGYDQLVRMYLSKGMADPNFLDEGWKDKDEGEA